MNAVLLASGGLDSTTLAYWMISQSIDFLPLFFDYGQHTASKELQCLRAVLPRAIAERIESVELKSVYQGSPSRMIQEPDLWREKVKDEDLFLPYRNSLLLIYGAAYAETRGISSLYSGFIDSNRAIGSDSTTEFLKEMAKHFSAYGAVSLHTPFSGMTKAAVAKIGISLKAPIAETYSCLASAEVACGACPNCVDRRLAFEALGL